MEGLIVGRWRKPRAGMERQAWEAGEQVDAYVKRLLAEGKLTGFEWIGGFTGSDGHMAIFRGDPAALMALSVTPEMMEIIAKAQMMHEDFRFDFAVSGSTVEDTWPGWKQLIGA